MESSRQADFPTLTTRRESLPRVRAMTDPTRLACVLLMSAWTASASAGLDELLDPEISGAYGPHPSQVYEYYAPPSHIPTRGVVAFHPGTGGGPSQVATLSTVSHIAQLLVLNGIGVYSFTTPSTLDNHIYPLQIESAARAIQYLRFNAASFGFDPDRLILWGTSFGSYVMGVLAYGPDFADPSGDLIAKQSTRPLAYFNQRGPSSFVIMNDIAYGGWFGKQTIGEVPDPIRAEASFAELVLSHATERDYTPPAISYYAEATGSEWAPPYTPPINPHDRAFGDYFMQALGIYALFHGDAQAWDRSLALLNPNDPPTFHPPDNEVIVKHILTMLDVDDALSVGLATSGSQRVPNLNVAGSLSGNSIVEFQALAGVAAPTLLMLSMGPQNVEQPIPCGGTLIPSTGVSFLLVTAPDGHLSIPLTLPPDVASGTEAYLQFLHADQVPCGIAVSNGIKVTLK